MIQTPEGFKFKMGDVVTKIRGSKWTGPVVGFYTGSMTECGYNVESKYEKGSIQCWPEAALELLEAEGSEITP